MFRLERGVLVASADADQFRWRLGDTVTLRMGDGQPVHLTLDGIFSPPSGPGELILRRLWAQSIPRIPMTAPSTSTLRQVRIGRASWLACGGSVRAILAWSCLPKGRRGSGSAWWKRSQARLLVLLA